MTEKRTLAERIERLFIPEPNSGCWLWMGYVKPNGYGQIRIEQADGSWRTRHAHRVSYEEFFASIPEGAELDHLCRMRCCINPDHLEPVSKSENLRRSPLMNRQAHKTQCPRGHAYSGIDYLGKRICKICNRAKNRRWLDRRHKLTAAEADARAPA